MGAPALPGKYRRRLPAIGAAALLLAAAPLPAPAQETVTFDLRTGMPLNFRDFGGPNIEIMLLRSDTSRVDYILLDYETLIPRARVPQHTLRFYPDHVQAIPTSGVAYVPTISSLSANKKDGFRLDGTLQTVVPLYSTPGGEFSVYWHDTLAARQNHLRLLVAAGAPAGQNHE